MGKISIVIGSWGSYNECNERSHGSKWLDLSDYCSWWDIEEELKNEGFELDGIDEELFVQDIEGINDSSVNWDYVNPQELIEALYESDIFYDEDMYDVFKAYLEVESLDEFLDRVKEKGSKWNEGLYYYESYAFIDYGFMMIEESGIEIPKELEPYFDYEAYGESFTNYGLHEVSGGLLEIQ